MIREWRRDPVRFVRENFQVEPDAWQVDALMACADLESPRLRISLQACAGPGKSAVLAWLGWWIMSCFGDQGDHPKGACVSISRDNLKDNLWAELARWRDRSPFLQAAFVWQSERIFARQHPNTWFLSARSFPKTANADEQGKTLSGLHSKYPFALIDESGAIPPTVSRAAEQALSTVTVKLGRIIQAGNPISHEGMLYAAATKLKHLWKVVRITGDPKDPKRSPRIDLEWAQEQIDTYGRDNPWVMAYILGMFPPSSINTLLGPDEVADAMARHLPEDAYIHMQKRLGVDVARFGNDLTVIFPRQGRAAFKPVEMRGAKSHAIAARVAMAKRKFGSEMEFIDDTGGYGSGVVDSLELAGIIANAINFSGSATDSRYYNIRSEMWWLMAEWVKNGGALPNHAVLAKELVVPTYYFEGGKIRLEEKAFIKKRLGFSPNYADALGLTFAFPEMPASLILPGGSSYPDERGRMKAEYDPYATKSG